MSAHTHLVLSTATLVTFWLALFSPVAPTRAEVVATAPEAVTSTGVDTELAELLSSSVEAYDAGRWPEALDATRALLERMPNQHIHLGRLAQIHHELGQPAEEAAAWERYMEWAPIPGDACPAIGHAYRSVGHYELALRAFERCHESDPRNAELTFFVGLGYEWTSDLESAREYYERANALAPPYDDSLIGLARIDLHHQRLAEALASAEAVLAHAPDHVDALLVAGLAEQRAGHPQAARAHLERAAALSAEYFDVQLALGVLEFSESRLPAARAHFETAGRLDPARTDELAVWFERTRQEELRP